MPGLNQGVSLPYSAPTTAFSYSTMFANLNPHHLAQTIFSAVSVVFVIFRSTLFKYKYFSCVLLQTVTEMTMTL